MSLTSVTATVLYSSSMPFDKIVSASVRVPANDFNLQFALLQLLLPTSQLLFQLNPSFFLTVAFVFEFQKSFL